MRVLVCSKRDLSSVVILNDLLERLAELGVVLGVMLAERTRAVETIVPELVRMKALERDLPFGVFFPLIDRRSTSRVAVELALAGILRPDQISDAMAEPRPPPVAPRLLTLDRLMDHHRLSYTIVRNVKEPGVLAAVRAFAPDVILSVRFSFRFPCDLVAEARLAAINVHPGRLPDYAGLYPHFYSMLAGERSLGCTAHLIDEGIDSGPVLAAGEVPIRPGRSAFANNLDSHLLGNRLVVDIVKKLRDGDRPVGKAHDSRPTKQHTYPTPEEFRAFHAKGLSLVDLREYVDLLQRLGLFDELRQPPGPRNCDASPAKPAFTPLQRVGR
jgi:folate-dependent phosphoribosylglycinamide formyltransferase PurN